MTLSPKTIEIVTACVPALEAHGVAITSEMYERLLSEKKIADLFNLSHQKDGSQPRSLATAVLTYAKHIENPAALRAMIERIAEKHVSLNILPEHYPYVGRALLGAIEHVLGDAATPEIMAAWAEAYQFLADVFISREAEIYDDQAHASGGWRGWRRFRVSERKRESDEMVSFELTPLDGKPVLKHKAGQYLGLKLDVHGSQRRNYSISSEPNSEKYRISVQRVDGGIVSEWFHNEVEIGREFDLSVPAGDFYLDTDSKASVALISGGSGVTPMISMARSLAQSGRDVRYIHSTRTPQSEGFSREIEDLAQADALKADIFYTRTDQSALGEIFGDDESVRRHSGRMTREFLRDAVPEGAFCYICGSQSFTLETVNALRELGFPLDRIRYELFGSVTTEELAVA